MSPISALKILLLVNSFMQISVDVYNEPFAIKCCSMYDPNESSAVYLLTSDDKYAVCGMDFSPESTSLPKIFSGGDFRSPAGQRKRSTCTDMQLWDLET